jgi:hypothetical protein
MVEIPGCFFLDGLQHGGKNMKKTHHISLYPISWMVYNHSNVDEQNTMRELTLTLSGT